MNGALSGRNHSPLSTSVRPILFNLHINDQTNGKFCINTPNTPAMATLAMSTISSTASSVGLLNSSHQSRQTPRQKSAPVTRARLMSGSLLGSSKYSDFPHKHITPDQRVSICDNRTVASGKAPSPLVHSSKPSFSISSGANSSTPNYILLNKLRIQQHTRKNVSSINTTVSGTCTVSKSTSFLTTNKSHHRSHSSSSKSSASGTHLSSSRSSSQTAPIVFSGPLSSSGNNSGNKPHIPRPIVTRITAQDWLNSNHQQIKGLVSILFLHQITD